MGELALSWMTNGGKWGATCPHAPMETNSIEVVEVTSDYLISNKEGNGI